MHKISIKLSAFTSRTGTFIPSAFYETLEASSVLAAKIAGVSTSGDDVDVFFFEPLTASEQTAFSTLVQAYAGYTEPSEFVAAKRVAKDLIDSAAGEARSRYMTVTTGQDAVYVLKQREAEKFIADGYPANQIAKYPHIKAESDATGLSYNQAADMLAGIALQWSVISAHIERLRIGGKKQIDQAADNAQIQDIVRNTLSLLKKV